MAEFIKLSNMVGQELTIREVGPFRWKSWSQAESKMLVSDTYIQGYRKIYTVQTDKGVLDLSSAQLASMLEAAQSGGRSDVTGKTFAIKSNGKTGQEIRYYFNVVDRPQSSEPRSEEGFQRVGGPSQNPPQGLSDASGATQTPKTSNTPSQTAPDSNLADLDF